MARLSFLRRIQYTPTINMVCLMQADIYSDGRKKYAFLTLNNPTGKWHDNALAKITPYDEDDNALPAFGIRMDISTVPPSGFFAYPDQIELPLDAVAFDFEFIRIDGVKVARYVATGDHAPKPKEEEAYVAPAPTPAPAAVAPAANEAQPQNGQATVLPESLRNEDGTKTVSGKVKSKYADSIILYTEYGALYVYADPSQLGQVKEGYTCSVTGVSKIVNGWERLENCSIFQVAEGEPDESLMAPGPINRGLPTAKEIKNAKNIEVISFRRKHISTAPIIVGSLFLAGAAVMMFGVTSFRAPFGPSGGGSSSGEVTEGNITYAVDRGANVASVKRINASGSTSVSIPQYTNQGVPVTTILGGAINSSSNVYYFDAPYVTNVETYAFVSSSLQRVTLGTDLGYRQALQIEGLAFDCPNLSELHLGGSVTLLDNNHFGKNLQIYGGTIASFSIPDSNPIYYSDCALTSSSRFFGSGNFNTLRIENLYLRNDTIPDYCFNNCHELYSINDISASSWQYNVSRYAFSGSNIDSLDLSACYSISYGAFKDCSYLSSVAVSSQLNSIGAYAFQNTPSLYNLNIPKYKSEINIDSTAFSPNTTVILKDGIYDGGQSSPSSQSFSWNTYNDGKYIHLTGYNGSATYPESIPSDVNVIDSYALSLWPYGNIELPYSVSRVEGYAFGNALTTLNIQSDVTFADNAFSNSNNLNKIAGNDYYLNFEGVSGISSSVDIQARRIDFMDNSFADSSANVNVSIDEFYGNLGFFGQKGISSVYIYFHHGASNIDSYAFSGMNKLSRFQIDNSDGLLDIGAYAFNNCGGLSNFSFERVNSLDDYAFANTSIINASLVNATNIGFKVFEGGKLENVFLREGVAIQEESFPVNATINYI